MRRTPILHLASVVALALALVGCGSAGESPADPGAATTAPTTSPPVVTPTLESPTEGEAKRVTMTGAIEDGVESGCLVFTDEAAGETYSVTEELPPDVPMGVRVSVTGTVDPDMMSFCMQGPILLIDEVTEAPPTP